MKHTHTQQNKKIGEITDYRTPQCLNHIDGIKNEFLNEIRSNNERNTRTNNKNVYEEKKIYKCGECDVRFTTKNHLEEHITVHDQKELFKCINCDRTFAQKSNLEEHFENFHNVKKPSKCEISDNNFSESNQMDGHVSSSYDMSKLFQCTYLLCEKFCRETQTKSSCPFSS